MAVQYPQTFPAPQPPQQPVLRHRRFLSAEQPPPRSMAVQHPSDYRLATASRMVRPATETSNQRANMGQV